MIYTKGPWKITNNAEGPVAICHAEDSYSIVCSFNKKDPQPIVKNEANAHLIAAAPEMIEVLESVLQYFEDGLLDLGKCGYLKHDLRQIIMKARGENK